MIYADVNLKSGDIDNLVEFLNKKGFFYSGVLFYRYNGDDYLRLQLENTHNIEEKLKSATVNTVKNLLVTCITIKKGLKEVFNHL